MSLATRRLPPLVAGLIGAAVLGMAVAVGLVAGGDFGGAGGRTEARPAHRPGPISRSSAPGPGAGIRLPCST